MGTSSFYLFLLIINMLPFTSISIKKLKSFIEEDGGNILKNDDTDPITSLKEKLVGIENEPSSIIYGLIIYLFIYHKLSPKILSILPDEFNPIVTENDYNIYNLTKHLNKEMEDVLLFIFALKLYMEEDLFDNEEELKKMENVFEKFNSIFTPKTSPMSTLTFMNFFISVLILRKKNDEDVLRKWNEKFNLVEKMLLYLKNPKECVKQEEFIIFVLENFYEFTLDEDHNYYGLKENNELNDILVAFMTTEGTSEDISETALESLRSLELIAIYPC